MKTDDKLIYDCPKAGCVYSLFAGRCKDKCRSKHHIEATEKFAYWEHRAKYNDFIWVECSNCGFRVENYKAVIADRGDTGFSGVKYNYCPICGKPMKVH